MDVNLDLFQIHEAANLLEAFKQIDSNKCGIVFVVDKDKRVLGVATDGDIRRWLIKKSDTSVAIATVMNKSFVSVTSETPRENVLKLLDHRIHVVPVLSKDNKILALLSRDSFPLNREKQMTSRARSPVRAP